MATVTVPAGAAVSLDPGGAYSLTVTNSGSQLVVLSTGERLRPAERVVLYPRASTPVLAISATGSAGQVDVTTVGGTTPTRYTTTSRPSAAAAGPGGFYYDTTLGKPAWSDGTVWRDAAGTAV